MKDFQRGRALRKLSLVARLVYTIFLAFTLTGLCMTAWLTSDMVGLDLSGAAEYYAGTRPAAPEARTGDPGQDPGGAEAEGLVLDLPDDLGVEEPTPMSDRKLLEVTHFHLFTMPVYLLILSHIFMLSALSQRARTTWIAIGTVGTAAHMAAPWLAAADQPGSTAFYAVSGAMLGVAFLVMCLVPLWEMWGGDSPARSTTVAEP